MKYKCKTKGCEQEGKVIEIFHTTSVFRNGKITTLEQVCKKCGQMMEDCTEKKEGDIEVYFGRFNSMSLKEKRRILKQRSTDHFNKKIKEKKEYMDRKAYGTEN